MSTKVKLISAIMALIIVTSIMIVGVMALSNVTFNMSGTVNFVASPLPCGVLRYETEGIR